MTKEEFKQKYPQGENRTMRLFKNAFRQIMESHEINKLIKYAKGKEKKDLVRFNAAVNLTDDCPGIVVLSSIPSADLLKDIIVYMISNDDQTYYGEDLPDKEEELEWQ